MEQADSKSKVLFHQEIRERWEWVTELLVINTRMSTEWVGEIHTFLSPAKNRAGKCKFSCTSCCLYTLIHIMCPKDKNNQRVTRSGTDPPSSLSHTALGIVGCSHDFLSWLSDCFPSAPDNRKQSVPDADQWCDSFVSTNTGRTLPPQPPGRKINETQGGI